MRKTYLCFVLTLTASASCTKHDSDNILTSGIYASIAASANGGGQTQVTATLFLGNPINLDFIELQGDDQLIAESGGVVKVMTETEILNIVTYGAVFDFDDEGTEFTVQFLRTVDDGAPLSIATLPGPFNITTTPPAGASRGADLVIDWSPSGTGDRMSWQAQGDCINSVNGTITDDPGSMTIPANTLVKRQGDMIPDDCQVTVELRRSRSGILDQGYGEGGVVTGEQVRSLAFTSTL